MKKRISQLTYPFFNIKTETQNRPQFQFCQGNGVNSMIVPLLKFSEYT